MKKILDIVKYIIENKEKRNNLDLVHIQKELLNDVEYLNFNYNSDNGMFECDYGISIHSPGGKFKFIHFNNFLNLSICDFADAVKKDNSLSDFINDNEEYKDFEGIDTEDCKDALVVMFYLNNYGFQLSYTRNKDTASVSLLIPGW